MEERAIAIEGTIHGIDPNDVHPNMNKPIGNRMDMTQGKYSRPSGVVDNLPNLAASFSWYMLMGVAMMVPIDTACGVRKVSFGHLKGYNTRLT